MQERESLPDPVDEALLETFPASDPPAWWAGPSRPERSASPGFQRGDIDDVRGATMVDGTGARIGKIEDVVLDRHTGRPAWAAVTTGARHTLVPITAAFLNPDAEVQVSFAREHIKAAPTIEPDHALSRDLERSLWTHYGLAN
jgi:sporulation protein YlmC with PRC-barrel domain